MVISKDFVGLDTETINGYARLVCLSDGRVFKINNKKDVIDFFNRVKGERFIAYNADYDISALIKYFPKKVLEKMLKPIPTDYGGKKMFYVKDKFFKFGSNYIFDCLQFFQVKLGKASEKFLKEKKDDVDVKNLTEKNIYSQRVIDYCIKDSVLCLALFNYFRNGLPEDLRDVKPYSQASYSQAYFKEELDDSILNKEFNDIFRKGYIGGRFEIFKRGWFESVFVYDINSAYPDEICRLKGLTPLSVIKRNKRYLKNVNYSIYRIKIKVPDDVIIAPLSVKVMDTYEGVLCPSGVFETYVMKSELEALKGFEVEILDAIHIVSYPDRKNYFPFKEKMKYLYRMKKVSNNKQPFKTVLNGVYGKTCQATLKWISQKQKFSRYYEDVEVIDFFTDYEGNKFYQYIDNSKANFIYASEITAGCRMKMYRAAMLDAGSIIAIQTDSIISEKKLDLPISDKMGDWTCEKWDGLVMLGCGVYYYMKKGKWYSKSRGFRPISLEGDFVEKRLMKILRSNETEIGYKVSSTLSLRQARIRHTEHLANIIGTEERYVNINMDRKRVWDRDWTSGSDIVGNKIDSWPIRLPVPVQLKIKRFPFFPKDAPQIWYDVMEKCGGIRPFKNDVEIEEYRGNVPKPLRRKAGLPPDEVADELGFEDSNELYKAI